MTMYKVTLREVRTIEMYVNARSEEEAKAIATVGPLQRRMGKEAVLNTRISQTDEKVHDLREVQEPEASEIWTRLSY